MKIAINTRLLRKNHMDGIGWFTYNNVKRITEKNPDIEFHFLFDSGIEEEFLFSKNIVPHNLFPPAKHAILNVAWGEFSLKRALNKINPDLFFSPDGIISLGWAGKQYGVIHDINFVHIPQDMKWANRKYYNYFFPKFAHKASRLGTVSEFSKQDIVNEFSVAPEKIDVVYCGINSFYEPVANDIREQTKLKYSEGKEYFIFVGTLHPRKNIIRLMQAFDMFKKDTGSDMKLLLVGWGMYKVDEMFALKDELEFGNDIVFTGRLQNEELKYVFASAFCLTFVPYFEGFGIPPIEAMQCNVPVIAANATSIPEIVGDAALLVDPFNIESIKNGMVKIYKDNNYRDQLIQKGRERKDFFSWDKTADLLWEGITKVL